MVSDVFAFSIEGFKVRSQFGEKFNASFEIHLDFKGPVEVGLGNEDDYTKMGLERDDIVNALALDTINVGDELNSTVKIRSNNPLFFPSLNLVVWATHNGGTLLENFLVTPNFQKSLALDVRSKKKKLPHKEPAKYKTDFARSRKKTLRPPETREFVNNEPSLEKEQAESPESKATEIADDQSRPEKFIDPVPAKTSVMHRRRLSGVIWANPRPIPKLATVKKIEKKNDVPSLTFSKEEYVLQQGERLFSVARKFKVGDYHPAQVAATIWLHNVDKFMIGNIHGILKGVKLNLKNLEEQVSDIDIEAAGNILKNQALEWKLVKNATSKEEEVTTISEIPLPSEKLVDLDNLVKQMGGWQTTWEKKDLERHLEYYQTLETDNSTLSNKKQLLVRYPKSNLETFSKFIVLKEGFPTVFFTQVFFAEKLKSWGLKELDWVRTPSGWKIRRENFYEAFSLSGERSLSDDASFGGRVNAVKTLPFVIHISSHPNKSSALSLTNQLRYKGFDAYWVPVKISADVFIYRVYVGRFSDWKQAHRFVQILRKQTFGSHATAIPYPFTLQVGMASSLKDARVLLQSLRKFGFSGLLLVSYNELIGTSFRVVVGAFKSAGNSKWLLRRLKQSGFAGELISP